MNEHRNWLLAAAAGVAVLLTACSATGQLASDTGVAGFSPQVGTGEATEAARVRAFSAATRAAVAATGLHVVGNAIEDGAGHPFVPHGVNRSGTEYMCIGGYGVFDGPHNQAAVSAMVSWKINAVRVPLNEDCWLGINGVQPKYGGKSYQNQIAAFVNLLNANGLVAILDLHWNAPGSEPATGQEPMADADHAPAFWSGVASAFKSNSSVIFDLYNEPYVTSWSCWLDGGSASACGTTYTVAGMNSLIAAVRSTGATNVVMAGGIAYANDLSQWLQNKPSDPAGNLAASWHDYNFNTCNTVACFNATVAPLAKTVPVVAGEIGENDCADGYINTLMPWLDAHQTGYLGWAWNADFACTSGPSLITNYNGTPTAYGAGLRKHLAQLPL